ncbi:MAG: acetyl-CoA acetyltransferase [Dehalococcoidia bacterium]|nr:acetyl-CoA acetyltransferase [Dehalococcoidia bacterium]
MESIRDKTAIVGMGCCKFGENWDQGAVDMIVDAAYEAYQDAGIEATDVQAAWVGTNTSGKAGQCLAAALKFQGIPITRVENYCCTGMDAFRNAVFSVACGMYDTVLVVGYEKLKDLGTGGLVGQAGAEIAFRPAVMAPVGTPGSYFGMASIKYFQKYGATREHLAKIAVKNHHNGSLTPKAHFQKEITLEQALNAPMIAWPLGLFDCCGVTDGAAAAVITSKALAKKYRQDPVYVKGLGLSVDPIPHMWKPGHDYLHWPSSVLAGKEAYKHAGITNPFKELSVAELHDCFTITELLTYEDLGFCKPGEGKDYVDSGAFQKSGELPVNTDGGLKAFGHPVGATGLRMMYEIYKQIQGKAGPRQVKDAHMGLAHNLGGHPSVASVTILGR